MKFKPHSRFALPFCIFPVLIAGVYRNFPKQNTLYSYIFPKFFVGELLVWGTPLYDKKVLQSCGNYQKNHTFRTIASILFRFPANFAGFYNINSAIVGVKNHPYRV